MSRIFEEEIKIFYPFYQFEPRDIHSASVDSNGEPIYAMPLADVNHIIAVLHSNTGYDAEIISDILVAINKHIVDKEYDKAYYLACDFNNIKYSYLLTLSQSSNKVMLSDYEVDHIIEGIADALKVSLGKSSFFFTSPEDLLSNNELYHDYFIINNAENRKKASEMFNISAQNKISSKISIQACVQKLCRKFAAWHDYVKYDKDGLILYTRQLADKLELYPDEAIYLLYDDTLIGKNKSGFAVTERGLHWTVNFEKYPVHMTFDELARALRIEKGAGDFDIKLDNSKVIGSFNNRDDVITLMHGIKFYADLLKSFTGHYYGVRNY
jgi:hypothetical protein